jgi:hypothetical protein
MDVSLEVTQVENGYIVRDRYGKQQVYKTLDEVFQHALAVFEGRAPSFGGDSYGHVKVLRKKEAA